MFLVEKTYGLKLLRGGEDDGEEGGALGEEEREGWRPWKETDLVLIFCNLLLA